MITYFTIPMLQKEKNNPEWQILLQVKPLGLAFQLHHFICLNFHHFSLFAWDTLFWHFKDKLPLDKMWLSPLECFLAWIIFAKWMFFNYTYYYKTTIKLLPLLTIQKSCNASVLLVVQAKNWWTLVGEREMEDVMYAFN